MTRAMHWPACTDTPLQPRKVSAAEAWAVLVKSDVMIKASTRAPDGRFRTFPAVNTESRSVLVALARSLPAGKRIALVHAVDLSIATHLSTRRLLWCLRALRAAMLLGPFDQVPTAKGMALRVELMLPVGVCQ